MSEPLSIAAPPACPTLGPEVADVQHVDVVAPLEPADSRVARDQPTWVAAISGPLALLGVLFLASRARPARIAA